MQYAIKLTNGHIPMIFHLVVVKIHSTVLMKCFKVIPWRRCMQIQMMSYKSRKWRCLVCSLSGDNSNLQSCEIHGNLTLRLGLSEGGYN